MTGIKAGDTVQLKSGGQIMTVEYVKEENSGNHYVKCVWFDGAEAKGETFRMPALQIYTDPGPLDYD